MLRSPILNYGFAVGSTAVALGLAQTAWSVGYGNLALPLFSLAIVMTTWHTGVGPSIVAVLLSAACFTYFFTEPQYSLEVHPQDLPNFFIFTAWAIISARFVAVRRRIEDDLRTTRDRLQIQLDENTHRTAEISNLNKTLESRAVELNSSNKELESFAYSVSHDLRAPLRHLVGYSELLQKQAANSLDDKALRYTQTIHESSKRMGNLIDDLLSFSRIGRAEARMTSLNLDQKVQSIITELAEDAEGRNIEWRIGPLPPCHGDRSMVRLVLVNLLSNAVKFTRKQELAVIEVGAVEANDQIEVFVKDNGAGFDMQYANKLFGVFQRLHHADEFEGTGIGLAIVQRIVHRHGGEVRVAGAVGKGATFYFTLPKAHCLPEKLGETA
jgi:signal transduction histidine kinase